MVENFGNNKGELWQEVICALLADLGVTLLNGPTDRPWGIRTASFTDPSGHVWEVAGPPSTSSSDEETKA